MAARRWGPGKQTPPGSPASSSTAAPGTPQRASPAGYNPEPAQTQPLEGLPQVYPFLPPPQQEGQEEPQGQDPNLGLPPVEEA